METEPNVTQKHTGDTLANPVPPEETKGQTPNSNGFQPQAVGATQSCLSLAKREQNDPLGQLFSLTKNEHIANSGSDIGITISQNSAIHDCQILTNCPSRTAHLQEYCCQVPLQVTANSTNETTAALGKKTESKMLL